MKPCKPHSQPCCASALLRAVAIPAVFGISLAAVAAEPPKQVVTPPIAQYWMDIATFNMMGMDEMPDMGGMAGMMGGMMNRTGTMGRDGRRATGIGNFGETRQMGIGRRVDIALHTRNKPAGTRAVQQVPAGANLGMAPLHLITPPREAVGSTTGGDIYPDKPRGRILFYWGCSSEVKQGQPRVLDMATFSIQDYAGFMQGRSVVDRGARAEAGNAIWPNQDEISRITKASHLVGEHQVTGEGVPESLHFSIDEQHDFMPSLQVQLTGKPQDSIQIRWQTIRSARAYLHVAISAREGENAAPDMVIWSSSEPPESGMGLLDYISNANVDAWLKDRVLLPPSQTECAIPRGIFADYPGAALQSIAYGNELNLVHPARPSDPKLPWNQEWLVRVRNKSFAMNMLGEEGMSGSRSSPQQSRQQRERPGAKQVLRGLFGR